MDRSPASRDNGGMSSEATMASGSVEIDRESLRARYLSERDKRLRSDGNAQYVEVVGEFARFVDDPYVEPKERSARHDEVTFAFIGGGFAGLTTGPR